MGLPVEPPPNKRLKLPGGYRSKGNGVLCAGAHKLSFNNIALGGRVARSLSATVRRGRDSTLWPTPHSEPLTNGTPTLAAPPRARRAADNSSPCPVQDPAPR